MIYFPVVDLCPHFRLHTDIERRDRYARNRKCDRISDSTILINIKTPQKLPTNKVWIKSDRIPPSSKLHTAGTKFPTVHLLGVTTPLQFYSQLWQSIGSLMNVSVSTDGLHSPVCVFYVDSSLPWPAESAVSGPLTLPIFYTIHRLLVLSPLTSSPLLYFTKGYQPLALSSSELPPPLILHRVQHPLVLTKWVKKKKKKGVLSVFRSGRTCCLSTQICSLFVCSGVGWRQETIPSWSSYLGDISVCNPRSPACVITQPTFNVLLSHYIYTHITHSM